MPVAINDAGDILTLGDDGQWKPATIAEEPKSGRRLYLDGKDWKPVTDLQAANRTTGETVTRAVSQPAQGFNESLATTLGAIPDLVGAGMRGIGLPSSAPGFYTDMARRGIRAVTSLGGTLPDPPKAETGVEKALFAGGRGVGDAASVLIPATAIAQGARVGSMTQGIAQALASQPVTQMVAGAAGGAVGEATDSPTAGLAASVAAPLLMSAATRTVRPIRPDLDPERQRLIASALREDVPLTAAQRTGSTPLRYLESALDTLPMTSGAQAALQREQQAAINQAIMARTGTAADNATPETLRAVRDRLGGRFNELAARNKLNANNPQFLNDLSDLTHNARRYAVNGIDNSILNRVDDILSKVDANGMIPGRAYRELDSEIGRAIRGSGNNGDMRNYLGQIRDALRNGMDASISGEDATAWRDVRRQYANYAVIRDAMAGAGEAASTGNIPGLGLQGALKRSVGRGAYAEGSGDLNDMARIAQSLLRKPPDSGTPGRMMMINLLQGGAGGVGAGALAADPTGAALGIGAALTLPKLLQTAYHSPAMQDYLINGIPKLAGVANHAPQLNREIAAALLAARVKDSLPAR